MIPEAQPIDIEHLVPARIVPRPRSPGRGYTPGVSSRGPLLVGRSVSALLVGLLGFSASMTAAAPVPPGSQIELLPVAGASFFPGAVVASSDGAHVYAGFTFDVTSFSRDVVSGELTQVDIDAINHGPIAISPDGAHVYVAVSAQLEIFERNAESGTLDSVGTVTTESGGTEALEGIVSLAVSPDGSFVYVVTRSSNGILVFERSAQTGALGTPPLVIDMTVTPSKIVFSPDGAHAYVSSNSEQELRVYARSSETGDLTLLDTLNELVFTVDDVPSSGFDVAISPSGERVEVTSAPERTIAAFTRDASTGALTFADELVVSPFGTTHTWLRLVTGNSITWVSSFTPGGPQPTSEARLDLVALSRDPATDDFLLIDSVTLISASLSISDLALPPDEQHVYFGGFPDGVGGARLVPEPAATALTATAIAALLGLRARERKERRAPDRPDREHARRPDTRCGDRAEWRRGRDSNEQDRCTLSARTALPGGCCHHGQRSTPKHRLISLRASARRRVTPCRGTKHRRRPAAAGDGRGA